MQRLLLILGLLILVFVFLPEFGPTPDAHFAMQIENVGGRPQLLLQYQSSKLEPFTPYVGIYTPKGDSVEEWDTLLSDKQGPTYGAFNVHALSSMDPQAVLKLADQLEPLLAKAGLPIECTGLRALADDLPEPQRQERLGLFHPERMTLLDLSTHPPKLTSASLPFRWAAETIAQLNGVSYAFGAEFPARALDDEQPVLSGKLKVARFNGANWEELKLDSPGSDVKVEVSRSGFLLKALVVENRIRVFWRDLESDQLLAAPIEGLRLVTNGKLHIADFTGEHFQKEVETIAHLPRGNICAWSKGPEIFWLIQTRAKPTESPAMSGPMEIWSHVAGQPALKEETVGGEGYWGGVLAYTGAERFVLDGQEYILRTNWQKFDLWKRESNKSWKLAVPNVKLPTFNVEASLLTGVFIGLAMLAFCAGLSWRKRVAPPGHRIHPREIYATLGLRVGAFCTDLILIFVAAYWVSLALGMGYVSPLDLFQFDLSRNKLPFFLIYIFYLSLTEWLMHGSLGKYAMGLRVYMATGTRLTLPSAFGRNLTGFFERMPQVALVPMFMMFFSPFRQRLGDLLSRSIVIHRGTLDAFKRQRLAELAARKALAASTEIDHENLPALDVMIDADETEFNDNLQREDKNKGDGKGKGPSV